jgi:carbon storage regulator
MLVITRREGETIHVGKDVKIIITQVRGGKVRVGVEAPKETLIWRGELGDKAEPHAAEEETKQGELVPA